MTSNLNIRKSIHFILCLFIFLAIDSCKQDDPIIRSADITINEAKTYFENSILITSKKGSAVSVSGTKKMQIKKRAQWERALNYKIGDRNMVVVPLQPEDNESVQLQISGKIVPMGSLISMIMYKDNKDVIHTEVVKRIPDDISEMHPKTFNGMIIVEDWQGNFIKG